MSPQVADIFNDRMCKNTSFNLTFENIHAEYAVDFNKHFAQILRRCDGSNMFGWCQFKPTDEVEPYDQGEIKTGFYYIECDNAWPFHGY